MKNLVKLIGIITMTVVLVFCVLNCGGGGDPTSVTYNVGGYSLRIDKAGTRAVYNPVIGDNYTLTTPFGVSNGQITNISGANTFTLSKGGTITVSSNGITNIIGTITLDTGETIEGIGAIGVARSSILIGIAMPSQAKTEKDGTKIKEVLLELGYQVELVNANENQNTQNTQIQTLMDNGARMIIVNKIDNNSDNSIKPFLAEAKNKGVIIIAYDWLIKGTGDYDYFITFDNYGTGRIQGQSIVDALDLNTPKNIVLFAGSKEDTNSEFFLSGALEILAPYISSGKLTVADNKTALNDIEIANWWAHDDNTPFKNRMDSLSFNNIHAVLAPNDISARYIIGYIKDKNLPVPIVTGQDAEFDSALSIKNNEQHMTIFKNSIIMAGNIAKLADQILQGESISVPGVAIATGAQAEMGNTGVKRVITYLQEPTLITKNNLNALIGIGWFNSTQESQLQ